MICSNSSKESGMLFFGYNMTWTNLDNNRRKKSTSVTRAVYGGLNVRKCSLQIKWRLENYP